MDLINFFKTKPAAPPAKIIALRSMVVTGPGGTFNVGIGDEAVVTFECLRRLDREDYTLIDSGRAKMPEVEDPSPAREDHRPLPARWDELPKCFSDFWNLTEQFRVAREHLTAIVETRVSIFGTDLRITEGDGVMLMGRAMHANPTRRETGNLVSTVRPIDTSDPQVLQTSRHLARAEDLAEDYLDRLKADQTYNLQKSFLECGHHRLTVAEDLRHLLEDLREVGFSLFSARVAALGLADFQIHRLFHGSADHQRYSNFPPSIVGGMCSAGFDENSQPIIYSDAPIASQAQWSLDMSDRFIELRPLLTEGRKALAKALKVAA